MGYNIGNRHEVWYGIGQAGKDDSRVRKQGDAGKNEVRRLAGKCRGMV